MRLAVLRLLILLGSALMTLQACSLFPPNGQSLPVEASQLGGGGLPLGYELHAVLTLEREGASREYLMALRTDLARVRLALMTPQGLPVYVVTGSKGTIAVQQQLRIEHLLTPDMVVRYLLMVYGSNESLHQALAGSDWKMEVEPTRRHFLIMGEVAGSVAVTYRGEPPWYKEVILTNSGDDTRMIIRTLESFDVVPE